MDGATNRGDNFPVLKKRVEIARQVGAKLEFFYSKVVQWQVNRADAGGDVYFALVNGLEGTWDAFFWVSDAVALHAEFKSKGAVIVYGPLIQHQRIEREA